MTNLYTFCFYNFWFFHKIEPILTNYFKISMKDVFFFLDCILKTKNILNTLYFMVSVHS